MVALGPIGLHHDPPPCRPLHSQSGMGVGGRTVGQIPLHNRTHRSTDNTEYRIILNREYGITDGWIHEIEMMEIISLLHVASSTCVAGSYSTSLFVLSECKFRYSS
jgi:hypothetical protein